MCNYIMLNNLLGECIFRVNNWENNVLPFNLTKVKKIYNKKRILTYYAPCMKCII